MDPLLQAFDLLDQTPNNLTTTNRPYQVVTPINMSETPNSFKVAAEVPGFKIDEISIDVTDRTIMLKGERKEDSAVDSDETNLRVEKRRTAKFERSIRLPADVDSKKVKATLHDGILDIVIGKLAASKGFRIPITIK
jgi:HSP20 family protein